MKQILIVIPTYNEADNVPPLVLAVDQVFQKLTKYQADILFVDDESPDGTADRIRQLQRRRHDIYLLSGAKAGLGKAYIRGLTYGLRLKPYFAVVTMDADLSHDPEALPPLLAELDKGADYVIGSRYVAGGRTALDYSPVRRLQSAVANLVAKYLIDIKTDVKDLTGGYKALRASKLRKIPLQHIDASGYVFQVSLLYEFAKRGAVIREVPITFHARQRGHSKLRLRDVTEFLRLTFRLNPRARLPRLLRFAMVGASGTVVNVGVLVALVHLLHYNVTVAYLAALETSIISNFALNHWFTFRFVRQASSGRTRTAGVPAKLLRYNLVSLAGVAIALAVFTFTYRQLGLHYVVADLLGIVAAMSWNYWLSVQLVWRLVDATEPSGRELVPDAQDG